MLGTIRRMLGFGAPKPPAAPKPRGDARQIRARYDAAQTTSDNQRHWAAADLLSAAAANTPGVRRLLRSRSRYEVANNSYAKGILLTLANDRIGVGPRLQIYSEDEAANTAFETAWHKWAEAIGLPAKLRTASHAYDQDGEAPAQISTNMGLKGPIKLDWNLFECDRLAAPFDRNMSSEEQLHDGIEFDSDGNPTNYWIHDRHPGERLWLQSSAKKISAEYVTHWFRVDRPGQTRGVPTITPALPLFAELRRYTLAVIAAAETAADFAAILKTTSNAAQVAEVEAFAQMEIERRMMTVAPEGWDAYQMKAEQPTTTYGEFKKEIINEIARCLNVPFNVAAGNSSSYNYASGRLDHQVYHRAISIDRDAIEARILMPLLRAFAIEYALTGGKMPPGDIDDWVIDWLWPGFAHVDPTKEATAQGIRLANFTTTLEREWAQQGDDFYRQLPRMIRAHKAIMAAGMVSPFGAKPTTPGPPPSDPNSEPSKDENPPDGGDTTTDDAEIDSQEGE